MSLSTTAITAGIAALTVPGVNIYDIKATPENITVRDCPCLFPSPENLVGGGNTDGPATMGVPTARFWMFTKTLRYVYLHAPVGSARSIRDVVPDMCDNLDLIMEAIAELDVTDKDVMGIAVNAFGALGDPAGSQQFWGCTLDIQVREKVNP
jgi:hypothetical protein